MTPAKFSFFLFLFFFFLPIFTHLDLFSTFLPSIRRPSIFPSIPLSFLVSPTLRRKGFLGDTILERSNCSHGFLVLLFFFFLSLRFDTHASDRFKAILVD